MKHNVFGQNVHLSYDRVPELSDLGDIFANEDELSPYSDNLSFKKEHRTGALFGVCCLVFRMVWNNGVEKNERSHGVKEPNMGAVDWLRAKKRHGLLWIFG